MRVRNTSACLAESLALVARPAFLWADAHLERADHGQRHGFQSVRPSAEPDHTSSSTRIATWLLATMVGRSNRPQEPGARHLLGLRVNGTSNWIVSYADSDVEYEQRPHHPRTTTMGDARIEQLLLRAVSDIGQRHAHIMKVVNNGSGP